MKTAWIFLIAAGLCEVVWSVALSYSNGLTRIWPSLLTITVMLLSFYLLSLSMRVIPLGTAYAVFTGIGTVGAALWYPVLEESRSPLRMVFLFGLVLSIIGLRLVSTEKPSSPKAATSGPPINTTSSQAL